jgi:internalin A
MMHSFLLSLLEGESPEHITELRLDYELIGEFLPDTFDALSGLELLPNLSVLTVRGHALTSLAGIEHLPLLRHLDVGHNALTDLSPIAHLPHLETLVVSGNRALKDLAPLRTCPQLQHLYAKGLFVSDWSVLAALPRLSTLHCHPLTVASLAPAAHAQVLHLSAGRLSGAIDLSILPTFAHCTALSIVNGPAITAVQGLARFPALRTLDLRFLGIHHRPDTRALPHLTTLDLRHTPAAQGDAGYV